MMALWRLDSTRVNLNVSERSNCRSMSRKNCFFFHSNLYDGVVAEEEHCQKHTQTEIIFVHLLDKLDKCK